MNVGTPNELNCTTTQVGLSASVPVAGSYLYQWNTTDGNILSGATSQNPQVNQQGTYLVVVTNTQNGCVQTDNVIVTEDVTPPAFTVANPQILTCTVLNVPLNATGTNLGPSPAFTWSTNTGPIVRGANSLNAIVNQPGSYTLSMSLIHH